MTTKDNLKNELQELGRAIGSDRSLIQTVMSSIDAGTSAEFNRIKRRFTMNRLTKLAAAAVLIVAVALSITIVDRLASPAYAIEQTIEAFKNVRFMHIIKHDKAGNIEDERWIEIGPDGTQARYRQDTPPNFLVVDDRKTVFAHSKDKNTVVLYDPADQWYTWIHDLGTLFDDLAGDGNVVIEENVDYWGRKAHLVRWLKLNMDCYIDPETKLPIAMTGYEISYEEPPEDIFSIPAIPEGVILVDKRLGTPETTEPEWMKEGEIAGEQFKQARHALAEGQQAEAAELFARVVEVQPGRNWAWFWLGKAHYELGEYDTAIYEYSKVIDMFTQKKAVPHYCYLARGHAYAAKGMEDMARQDFSVALPVMIETLRNVEGAFIFDYADDPLLRDGPKDKWPTAAQSLTIMIDRLRIMTGQNFGYDPDAGAEEKEQAISAWEQWYQNSTQF